MTNDIQFVFEVGFYPPAAYYEPGDPKPHYQEVTIRNRFGHTRNGARPIKEVSPGVWEVESAGDTLIVHDHDSAWMPANAEETS